VALWVLKVAQQTAQVPVSFGPFWLCIFPPWHDIDRSTGDGTPT